MKIISRFFLAMLLVASVAAPTSKASADNVDGKKARNVGAYFMAAQFGNKSITGDNLELVYEIPNVEKGIATLYAFNTADKRGFVIVAGSDCVEPIVAYSTDGSFDPDNIPPAMQAWLGEQSNMIAYCQNEDLEPADQALKSWRTLDEQKLSYFGQDSKAIISLLNTKWNQNYPYNSLCPTASNGTSDTRGLAYAGCVATALSQIIRYWEYPRVGASDHGYHVQEPGVDTDLYVDFSQAYYDYENMPEKIVNNSDPAQINAISLLMYHCGVAVDMGYDGDGSGAQSGKVVDALRRYFKYESDSIRFISRSSMMYNNPNAVNGNPNKRDTAWVDLIVNEIMNQRPVYYAAYSPYGGRDAGHAFVCDGWNTSTKTLHFNWGWGGSGDCWCNVYTVQLKPRSSPQAGVTYHFYDDNRVIVGVTPPQDSIRFDPLSIAESENPFVSAIYPNPASTQVTVSYKLNDNTPAMLQIFDAAGRMIDETEISPVSTQVVIPVGNLNPGIYFCRINGHTQKFVVR